MKVGHKELLERLEVVLKHQIGLGINHIFCSTISGVKPSLISFHHLLNRLMVALQLPVCFCLFKKDSINSLSVLHISVTHYHYRTIVRKKAFEIVEKYRINPNCPTLQESIYPLFSEKENKYFVSNKEDFDEEWKQAEYYLGVIIVKTNRDNINLNTRYNFEWIRPVREIENIKNGWDVAGYKLSRILQYEKYEMFGQQFFSSVFDSIDRMQAVNKSESINDVENRFTNNNARESLFFEKGIDDSIEYYDTANCKFYEKLLINQNTLFSDISQLEGKSTLDKVFNKTKYNVNLVADNPNNNRLTNFLFFVRDYDIDENYRRYVLNDFEGFNYRVRIAICSEQAKEIEEYFISQCKRYINNPDTIFNETKYGDDSVKRYVWDTLVEFHKINDLKSIIQLLGAHFTKYTMSFSDNCFRDCMTQYTTPFNMLVGANRSKLIDSKSLNIEALDIIKANEDKIFSTQQIQNFKNYIKDIHTKPKIEQKLFDSFRAFLVSILFSEMCSNNEHESKHDLHTQLTPIELGGRVWGVISYVTNISKPEIIFNRASKTYSNEDFRNDTKLYNSIFLQNFNQANLLMDRIKKNIRIGMEEQYFNDLVEIYTEWYLQMFDAYIEKPDGFDFNSFFDEQIVDVNQRFASLCFFYPYKQIVVDYIFDYSGIGEKIPPYSSIIATTSNQCFFLPNLALQLSYGDDSLFSTLPSYKRTTEEELYFSLTDVAVKFAKVSFERFSLYVISYNDNYRRVRLSQVGDMIMKQIL